MELDLQTVDAILSGESSYLEKHDHSDLPWLDLSSFTSCSDSVLEYLVSNIAPLEYFWFGVETLPLRHALKLRRMKIGLLALQNLISLEDDAAYALGGWEFGSRPTRTIDIGSPLSVKAAQGLVGKAPPKDSCDSPLHVSLPSLSPGVADILRQHTHELSVSIQDEELTPEIAEILAKHDGYELQIWVPRRISEAAQLALSRNPSKRISIQKDGTLIYVVDCSWWSSSYEEQKPPLDINQLGNYLDRLGIQRPDGERFVLDIFLAKRLMQDGFLPALDRATQLDLSVFADITPETLDYLKGFECLSVGLGIRRLSARSAKSLSGWNTRYLSFAGETEFEPLALHEFRCYVGNLYLGRIDNLDQGTAEVLATIDGEVKFSTPALSVAVATVLAGHRGELYIEGLKQPNTAALSELVRHQGGNLILMLDYAPEEACIRAMTSNTDKRVFRLKGKNYYSLNSMWAAMICCQHRCGEFQKTYQVTESDAVLG